jgi:hypothetical protein
VRDTAEELGNLAQKSAAEVRDSARAIQQPGQS